MRDEQDDDWPAGIPHRLYGRRRGKKLRPRQERLLTEALPRLRFGDLTFADGADALWFEVGFGGGEHTLAQMAANPGTAIIASEVYEHGLCSLLTEIIPDGDEATAPSRRAFASGQPMRANCCWNCRKQAWISSFSCSQIPGPRRGMPSAALCIRK